MTSLYASDFVLHVVASLIGAGNATGNNSILLTVETNVNISSGCFGMVSMFVWSLRSFICSYNV